MNYTWEIFEVQAGDKVSITLNMTKNGDPAFQVFPWSDYDSDDEVDFDEIGYSYISRDDGGAGYAESGSYSSPKSESIVIQINCWAWAYSENMTYELEVSSGYSLKVDNHESNPFEIEFDTYNLHGNKTVNLTLASRYETDEYVVEFRDVSFHNFFVPSIIMNAPITLGENCFNITWSSSDENADDFNYYSVWYNHNNDSYFQLLSQNLTNTYFVWDSSGFLIGTYKVRIAAYSVDKTSELCGLENPPFSYWPGDFTSELTFEFEAGNVHYGYLAYLQTLKFNSPPDISYIEGATGNQIVWTYSDHPTPNLSYVVRMDGTRVQAGSSENYTIIVPVDGLSVGEYTFEITIEGVRTDSVIVRVILLTNNDNPVLTGLAVGVAAGSATIIVIVGVLISRLMWRRKIVVIPDEPRRITDPWSILLPGHEEGKRNR
jgi:hypothetical protein